MAAPFHRENPSFLLEAVFRRIQDERMAGLPFLNPALEVAAVGFARDGGDWRGVLLTPWVMALLLLPAVEDWPVPPALERAFRHYPAGVFAFLPNEEEGVGVYLSCPLVSDMRQFGDQRTALATAQECLLLLDRPPAEKTSEMPASPRRRRFLALGD